MKKEMDIKELVNLMVKKRKMIIAIIILFTLAGSLISILLPSTFEAKADLLVNYTLKKENIVDL